MTADELRLVLYEHLRDDLDEHVVIQGKRLVVRDGLHTVLILCTESNVDDARERRQADQDVTR